MWEEYSWRSVSTCLLPPWIQQNLSHESLKILSSLSLSLWKKNILIAKRLSSSFPSSPWRWIVTTAMFTPYLNRRTRRSTPTKIESCSCRRSTSPWLITESSAPVFLNRLVSASSSPCDSDPSCNNQSLRFDSVFFLVS